MNNKSNFYYDAVKGIYLNDNIVKFNLVSVPMSQNDIEEKSYTYFFNDAV